jgi:flagellin-like hook-associated protein FlgL
MAERISLSASIRSNLLTLDRTTRLADRTQGRLATGLKVGSPLDNAAAFFAAASLSNRADDLLKLKDNIDQGISALAAAINGIEAITELVEQAKGIVATAKATSDVTERASLAAQFNALRAQINSLANDSSFNGTNLISNTPDSLTVFFNEDGSSSLTVAGIDSSTTGLNITVTVRGARPISRPKWLLRSSLSVTPWQEFVDACDFVVGDAAKNVGEPGLRIDAVELRRFDQRIGDGG